METYIKMSSLQVMTHGPSVKIPCVQDAPGASPEFKFPAEWGGSLMQCREPVPCLADFPVPPYHSGLVVSADCNTQCCTFHCRRLRDPIAWIPLQREFRVATKINLHLIVVSDFHLDIHLSSFFISSPQVLINNAGTAMWPIKLSPAPILSRGLGFR